MSDAPSKIRVLQLVGLPDDHCAEVLFLSPDQSRMRFSFDGNVDVEPLIDTEQFEVMPLVCGGVAGEAGSVPRLDVAFNTICDPDRNSEALERAAEVVDRLKVGVVNHPAVIARTGRADVAETLDGIDGVVVPATRRIQPRLAAEILLAARDGDLRYPFLIRETGSHGGQGLIRISGPRELPKLDRFAFDGRSFYATDFHDFRSADGLYRKYRVFVVGGAVIRKHLIISDQWMIHGRSRDFMAGRLDLKLEEDRWVLNGSVDEAAFAAMSRRLGLDFFGVDYGLLPDGRLIVFEVNACVRALRAGRTESEIASHDSSTQQIRDALSMLLVGRSTVRDRPRAPERFTP